MVNMTTSTHKSQEINHDDIVFYGRDSCPFCVKMKDELKQSGVYDKIQYKDIENNNNHSEYKQLNSNGVPHFQCKSTGKSATGFMSTDTLLTKLNLQ